MATCTEDMLLENLVTPGAAAAQADLAQAVALSRQTLSFRQRAGAAAARLRRAETDAEKEEASAALARREARYQAAKTQTEIANIKRPVPSPETAQVFARADGKPDHPPLTLAAINENGTVLSRADANAAGVFHIESKRPLNGVTLQVSDGEQCVFYRSAAPQDIPLGSVVTISVSLDRPQPKPSPVPTDQTMPDLVGQTEDVARTLLDCLGITDLRLVDRKEDGQAGVVLEQEPKPGTAIKGDTAVTLTVRRGAGGTTQPALLPDMRGLPVSRAEATLKELGLQTEIKRQPDDGPADLVLDQEPKPGTEIKGIDLVTLTVSERPQVPEAVTVPDLKGRSHDVAAEILKALDLEAEVKEIADGELPAGITDQDPEAGKVVPRKSVVTIVINTPPDVEPGLVAVPQMTGRTQAEAAGMLEKLGLKMQRETVGDAAKKGNVVRHDPAARTRVKTGSSVTLFVSDGSGGRFEPERDFAKLTEAIKADPRATASDLDVPTILRKAKITDLESLRNLAKLTPAPLRDQLKLEDTQAATRLRTILQRALKELDA